MVRTLGYGIAVVLALLLAGCGGGDEEKNLDKYLNSGLADGSGTSSDTAKMELNLLDCTGLASDLDKSPDNCPQTVNVSLVHPGTAHIQLSDLNDEPLANKLVQLTTDIATFSPTSGRQLTDENGEAVFTLYAKPEADASNLTATVAELGLTDTLSFAVSEPGLSMALDSSLGPDESLAADATMSITASIIDAEGAPYTSPVVINFSSGCAANDLAQLSESVTTVNGVATAVYKPTGCKGEDTIVATPELSALESISLNISIATTSPAAIHFVDASPQVIYLPESIGPKFATVRFQVLDDVGLPLSGQQVRFSLDAPLYGLTFSPATDISDSEGYVETKVFSGKMPGVIVVEASMPSPDDDSVIISGVSNQLAVYTGMPDSDSFSVSVSQHAVEAWNYDNVEVEVLALAADEHNNWVPDGTTVYFTTEGGAVQGDCKTVDGQCVAIWRSQDPRPTVATTPPLALFPTNPFEGHGRTTVLAVMVGQESFDDANINYLWDEGEEHQGPGETLWGDIWSGEAWLDTNENGIYDNGSEYYRDYNMNGEFDVSTGIHDNSIPAADELFNSLLCRTEQEDAGACTRDLVELFQSQVIIMATSEAQISLTVTDPAGNPVTEMDLREEGGEESYQVTIQVRDLNGNQMAANTQVQLVTTNGEIVGDTSYRIADGIRYGDTFSATVARESEPNKVYKGVFQVKVTSPSGLITTSIPIDVFDEN